MIWIVLLASIIIALIAIVPFVLLRKINAAINKNIQGYSGRVEHLSIRLLSGQLRVRDLSLQSIAANEQNKTTLQIPVIVVGFKWAQLFKKVLDLNVTIHSPTIHYVPEPPSREQVEIPAPTDQHRAFKDSLEKMTAFKVNIEVIEGEIQYVNPHTA